MSPLVFFKFFVTLLVKATSIITFYGVFDHFLRTGEDAKFWKIKLYFYVSSSYTRMNKQNMLIVAYMYTFVIFCKCHFVLWWKRIILSKSCYFGLWSPLIILRYQPLPICMYILIHSFKQNDENRTLSRVVPSTALIVYLNKFFSFFKSVFKLFIWITLRMKY